MGFVEKLVEQSRKPNGLLGVIMVKIMNLLDAGLIGWAVSLIDIKEGKILDIGCGGGETIFRLTKKLKKVLIYGIDFSADSVNTTKIKNQRGMEAGRVMVKEASVSSLPFEDRFFDIISAIRTHYF